jgi:ADP-heptose:LPS heptosyltransferase
MKSLLAVRLGGLGDLLAVLPALNLLRRRLAGWRIVLLARPSAAALLLARGVADEVRSAEAAVRTTAGFELTIGWYQAESSVPKAPGRYFVFEPVDDQTVSRYFFERTAEVLREFGTGKLPPFEECWRLPGKRPGPRIGPAVIHPGSGSPRKNWPLERFLALAAELARRGLSGRIVTGEAEEDAGARLSETVPPPGWNFIASPSLTDLAALLEGAPLYVGNDSGVTHLAAACGAPVVAFFRSEFVAAWRPFGHASVLSADDVETIGLEAAAKAAGRALVSGEANSCAIIGRGEKDR